jgi:hypothetical protein
MIFCAAANLRELVEPGIRHRDVADVRLDRAEGIIRRLRRLRLGQRVEQGGLADIGQPDDTAFETHESLRHSSEGWNLMPPIVLHPSRCQPALV